MTTKISYAMAFLLGLGMIFLGARFFFSPEAATAGFGIQLKTYGDYSFPYIKGIRDIFSGLLLCAFVLMNQRKAVGVTLLAGGVIPVNDMLIVLSKHITVFLRLCPTSLPASFVWYSELFYWHLNLKQRHYEKPGIHQTDQFSR